MVLFSSPGLLLGEVPSPAQAADQTSTTRVAAIDEAIDDQCFNGGFRITRTSEKAFERPV
jgi:hypothetical protein